MCLVKSEKSYFSPFGVVHNVLISLQMEMRMKMLSGFALGLFLAGADAVGQAAQIPQSFLAAPYFMGRPVPPSFIATPGSNRATSGEPVRGRMALMQKLATIVVTEIGSADSGLNGFSMTEAIETLNKVIQRRDPEGVGVNIIINPNLTNSFGAPQHNNNNNNNTPQNPGAPGPNGAAIDPLTGQPINGGGPPAPGGGGNPNLPIYPNTGLPIQGQGPPGGPQGPAPPQPQQQNSGAFNPDEVMVRGLNAQLRGLTALEVLDAITKSFDTPIRFRVEDYAVVLMAADPNSINVYTRAFRVRVNMFGGGLQNPGGAGGGTNPGGGGGGNNSGGGGPMGGGGGGGGPMGSGGGGNYPPGAGGGGQQPPGGAGPPMAAPMNQFRQSQAFRQFQFRLPR